VGCGSPAILRFSSLKRQHRLVQVLFVIAPEPASPCKMASKLGQQTLPTLNEAQIPHHAHALGLRPRYLVPVLQLQKRDALEQWAAHLMGLPSAQTGENSGEIGKQLVGGIGS